MRLIDADALLEELRDSCKWHAENSREYSLLYRDINIVKEQPTVQAFQTVQDVTIETPVRHGHLVNAHPYGECSECGYLIDSRDGYNYCPNCGAKMDGEV